MALTPPAPASTWTELNGEGSSSDVVLDRAVEEARKLAQEAANTSAPNYEPTFLNATRGPGNFGDASDAAFGASFSTIPIDRAYGNPALWNVGVGGYVVPSTGWYDISGSFRVVDSSTAGRQFGVGVHSYNGDGPWVLWHTVSSAAAGASRTSYPYAQRNRYNAGDVLRPIIYVDGGTLRMMTVGLTFGRAG